MAQLELVSNLLYVISGNEPTTANLPEGCCAFGTVDGKNVLFANISGTIVKLNDITSGVIYSSATSTSATTYFLLSTLTPSTVRVGDIILSSSSQLFRATSINSSNVAVTYLTTLQVSGARKPAIYMSTLTSVLNDALSFDISALIVPSGMTVETGDYVTTGTNVLTVLRRITGIVNTTVYTEVAKMFPTYIQEGGTAGYELIGNGSSNAPLWKQPSAILQCPTASGTTNKKAYVYGATSESAGSPLLNFQLVTGMVVAVKFTNRHTGSTSASLSIATTPDGTTKNYTTAYQIVWDRSNSLTVTSGHANSWNAGETLYLGFDGSKWRIIGRSGASEYHSKDISKPSSAGNFVTITSVTVAPGKVYQVSGFVQMTVSDANEICSALIEARNSSGTQLAQLNLARTMAASGGGVYVSGTIDLTGQTTAVTINLRSYTYYSATYDFIGSLYAVSVGD